jgi:hypothetical protein
MDTPVRRSYRRSGLFASGLTAEEQAAMTEVREARIFATVMGAAEARDDQLAPR